MSGLAAVTTLTLIFAACGVRAGFDWGKGGWGAKAGPLGDPDWWEGGGDYPPHGPAKVPTWLWFFREGKAGLDGRDGRIGDTGEKGDCGEQGEKGEKGDKGGMGDLGDDGDMGEKGYEGYSGDKGNQGSVGDVGDNATPMSGFATKLYTRWGSTGCPTGLATLVYSGRAGTSYPNNAGAGANIVCLADNFDTGTYDDLADTASTTFGTIVGIEYQLFGTDPLLAQVGLGHNVPCAVCSVLTDAVYVQPGAITCSAGWEVQYSGYVMAQIQTSNNARSGESYRSHYVCVDDTAESVVGATVSLDPLLGEASLAHVSVDCTSTLPSPFDIGTEVLDCSSSAYGSNKQISCVVCSRDQATPP